MEPVTIAAGVVALLAPFVRRAADEFASAAGQAVWNMTEGLLARVRGRLAGDQGAQQALASFERDPAGASEQLEAALVEVLESDPQFRAEIASQLAEIRQAGPQLRVVQKMVEAESVTGLRARRMSRGSATVEQEAQRAKDMTGIDLDEIG